MQSSRININRQRSSTSKLSGVANVLESWASTRMQRRSDAQSDKRDLEKTMYKEAADTKKAKEMEDIKAQHQVELAKLKATLTAKHGGKKKFKDPDPLELFMLTKGKFPKAMKQPKTPKGTDNPFAEYTPEEEAQHIAAIATKVGYVPDQTYEAPAEKTGGFFGIGGTETPPAVFVKYKPGPNAGGSIEMTPQTQEEPDTES